MFGFKTVVAAVTVATMIGSSAFAADGALAPGKPAGVKTAQIGTGTLLIAGGAVAVVAAIAIVVTNQSGDRANATTTFAPAATTSASPSP